MALYGQGFSLRSLLEDPNLQNPPNLNKGSSDLKKGGKFGGFVTNSSSAFLGSNLWDKPSNDSGNSNDFDLEYMDLDEFLSENGIPVNPDDNDESQTISLLATALARSPPRSPNPGSPGILIDPISPGNPRPVPVGDDRDPLTSFSNVSSPVGQPLSPLGPVHSPPQINPDRSSPQSVIERYLLDDNFGIKVPSPDVEDKPEIKETQRKRRVSDSDYSVAASDIGMMSIPGQDGFDPTARKFSAEELKPQPIIKKARKIFVDDTAKDDKYWQRRKKNNVAAKRSREARRVKENQIAMRAAFLESENEKLRQRFEKIQRENESLIKRLSKYEKVE